MQPKVRQIENLIEKESEKEGDRERAIYREGDRGKGILNEGVSGNCFDLHNLHLRRKHGSHVPKSYPLPFNLNLTSSGVGNEHAVSFQRAKRKICTCSIFEDKRE